MKDHVKTLANKAVRLAAEDRAALAETLLESLSTPDPGHQAAWISEAEARLLAYRRGELAAERIEEALRKLDNTPR